MNRAIVMRIDMAAIRHNVNEIVNHTGKAVFAVVKNNAYNFGLKRVASTLLELGVTHFAVTTAEEAWELKRELPQARVLQMNTASPYEIEAARAMGVSLAVTGEEWFAHNADRLGGVDLHMKINVGMNRFGIDGAASALRLLDECIRRGLSVSGLFTHFPQSEEDDISEHNLQVDEFVRIHAALAERHHFQYVHAENTSTILRRDERLNFCTHVRPGILMYGYTPPPAASYDWLKPTLFVSARVIDFRDLAVGDHLGYGTSYSAPAPTRIAILPIGYGDGLLRRRREMPVYIDGRQYDIAGKISMSHTYVQVDSSVKLGDEVEIYGVNARPDRLAAAGIAANSEQLAALHIPSL